MAILRCSNPTPIASRLSRLGHSGWLSDRVNSHFAVRYEQDLTHVDPGAPAEDILETFGANRRIEFVQGSIEINGKSTDGVLAGTSLTLGRQYVYGGKSPPSMVWTSR